MFVNPEVPLDSLPRAEHVDWHALHARFARCLQVKWLIAAVVPLAVLGGLYALSVYRFGLSPWWTASAVALLACAWIAICLTWPLVVVPRRGYAVRDKDILYKSGVWWQSVQVVPFNRVQHAVRGSGPLERRFGLASLTVYTAGIGAGDLRIAGLGEDVAERLRVYIVSKLRAAADSSMARDSAASARESAASTQAADATHSG